MLNLDIENPVESSPGGGGLEEWTPTLLTPPVVVTVDGFNTDIVDNAGNGNILSNSSQAGIQGANFFATAFEDFTKFDAVERGFYMSPTIVNNDGISGSQIFFAFSDGNPITGNPPATYALGIRLYNLGINQWQFSSITGVDGTLSPIFTDADIIGSNIGISVSTDGTNMTLKVYLNGISSDAPILTLTELVSSLGMSNPLTVDVTFGAYSSVNASIDTEIISYANAPIEYDNITKYTAGTEIDPASYPASRTNKSYQIVGLGVDADSDVGVVYDGVIFSFDGLDNPASRSSKRETFDKNSDNIISGSTNFTGDVDLNGSVKKDGNELASISTNFTEINENVQGNFTAIKGAKYLDESGAGIATITMPDTGNVNFEVDIFKALRFGAGESDGYILQASGGNWYIDGVDSGINIYIPTRGEYVKCIYMTGNSTWHISSFKTPASPLEWIQATSSVFIGAGQLGNFAISNDAFGVTVSTLGLVLGDEFKIMNNAPAGDIIIVTGGGSVMQIAGRTLTHQINISNGQILSGVFDGTIWQIQVDEQTPKFDEKSVIGAFPVGRNYYFDGAVTTGNINIYNNGGNAGTSAFIFFEAGGATCNLQPVNAGDIFMVIQEDGGITTKKLTEVPTGTTQITWNSVNSINTICSANNGYINAYNAGGGVSYQLPSYALLNQGDKIYCMNTGDFSMVSPNMAFDQNGVELIQGDPSAVNVIPGNTFNPFGPRPMVIMEYSGSPLVGWIMHNSYKD